MHLQDLGSGAYTDFDNDGAELIDLYDEYPDLMDMRCGLIHSHHTMAAFFSGTDQEELHEKAKNGLYFSLIVNNHMKPVAKLCWTGETEEEVEVTRVVGGWNLGGVFNRAGKKEVTTKLEKARIYYEIEFDIEFHDTLGTIADRYNELDEKAVAKQAKALHTTYGQVGARYQQGGLGGVAGTAGFQIPKKSIAGSQAQLFEGQGQAGQSFQAPETGSESEAYEAWAHSTKGITTFSEGNTLWEGLKEFGYDNKAYATFLHGEETDESFDAVMAEVMNEVKKEVECDRAEGDKARSFGDHYEMTCTDRAAELVSDGDSVIAKLAGEFFMDELDYRAFLIDLLALLEKTQGIFNIALRTVIQATLLEDVEEEDDEEEIIESIIASQTGHA
jgi:hypothetical protein